MRNWNKIRGLVTMGASAGMVAFTRPVSAPLFWSGVAMAALGESLRLWAAGNIKKNRELACGGPYALMRHPMYMGSLAILVGVFLAVANPSHGLRTGAEIAGAAAAYIWLYARTIRHEEGLLADRFGEQYARYAEQVPSFVPVPLRLVEAVETDRWRWPLLRVNQELVTLAVIVGIGVVLRWKMGR
jgi:protein-S-isoprenylcysteine O-methyltransferase Ste14